MRMEPQYTWEPDKEWVKDDARLPELLSEDEIEFEQHSLPLGWREVYTLSHVRRRIAVAEKTDPTALAVGWTFLPLLITATIESLRSRVEEYVTEPKLWPFYYELPSRAASVLPDWITSLYDQNDRGAVRPSLLRLLTEMQKLLAAHDFDQLDLILTKTDLSRLPAEIVMGLFRASAPAKQNLKNWTAGVSRALTELRSRGLPAESIMIGLHNRPNEAACDTNT